MTIRHLLDNKAILAFNYYIMLNLVLTYLLITAAYSVTESETQISSNRNQYRQAVCAFYSTEFTDEQRTQVQPLIQSYTYLTDQQIETMIFDQNYFGQIATETLIMMLPHAISLVVLIFMWPGLCCCCSRPDKFPVCKKFRKDPKEMYGKCELKWPAFAMVAAYLIVLVGSAIALVEGPDVTNYFNNFGCRTLAIADDTLYGRISPSDDTVFFVGLKPYQNQLINFQQKIGTFFSQSNSSLNTSATLRVDQKQIQNLVSTEYSSYTNIVYSNAFTTNDGVTYVDVNSAFKELFYGPITDSSKILGNINSQLASLFKEINAALDPMIAAWKDIEPLGSTGVSAQIDKTINSINQYESALNTTMKWYSYFDNADLMNGINLGFKLVYGVIVGLASLGIIAAILMAACTVVRARMLIYCTCGFLMAMSVITLALCIAATYGVSTMSQICAYADRQLATPDGTNYLLKNLKFGQTADLYKNCKSSGSGNMLPQLSPSFQTSFYSIDLLSDYTLQFNDLVPNFKTSNFQQPFNDATSKISTVNESRALDVNDSISTQFLVAVSKKSYTISSCTGSPNVAADSWVPSTNIISCSGGAFEQAACLDLSDLTICPQGCYQIFEQLTSPSGDPSAYTPHLQTRYGTGCNYAQYITNLHDNWNIPRMSEMLAIQSDLDSIQSVVSDYDISVKAVQASLNTFKSNLEANFNSQTNLETGSFNGFDCRVIGESIEEFRDAACVGFLSSIQYNFTMLIVISYGILLLSCFSVCAGVRHYQHLQKMSADVGYKGVPIAVSSKRITDDTFND